MDEADILGDRVAIMSAGKLLTVGTGPWLKTEYGDGFHLTMVKKKGNNMEDALKEQTREGPIAKNAINLVRGFCPGVLVYENTETEITLTLPFSSRANGIFAKMFRSLDDQIDADKTKKSKKSAIVQNTGKTSDQFGIETYGLKETTLERIFLTVTERAGGVNGKIVGKKSEETAATMSGQTFKQNQAKKRVEEAPKYQLQTGAQLRLQQAKALFKRRFFYAKRSGTQLLVQLAVPPMAVLITLFMSTMKLETADLKILLEPGLYTNAEPVNYPHIHSFFADENPDASENKMFDNNKEFIRNVCPKGSKSKKCNMYNYSAFTNCPSLKIGHF